MRLGGLSFGLWSRVGAGRHWRSPFLFPLKRRCASKAKEKAKAKAQSCAFVCTQALDGDLHLHLIAAATTALGDALTDGLEAARRVLIQEGCFVRPLLLGHIRRGLNHLLYVVAAAVI